MKMMVAFQSTILGLILVVLNGCGQKTIDVCAVYFRDPINISIEQVLTLPDCFDQKQMMTKGIIRIGESWIFVYPSRLDYDLGNNFHALVIDLNDTVDKDALSATIKDGSYVLLYGQFESPAMFTVSEPPTEIK